LIRDDRTVARYNRPCGRGIARSAGGRTTDQLRRAGFHVAQIDLRDPLASIVRQIGSLGDEGDKPAVAADRRMIAGTVSVAPSVALAHTPGALHDSVTHVDVVRPVSVRSITGGRRAVTARQIGARHEGHVPAVGVDRG